MKRTTWKIGAALAVLTSITAFSLPLRPAGAMPRGCTDDPASCPDPREPPGGETGPADPAPQPQPPAPYRNATALTYSTLGLITDGLIATQLAAHPFAASGWPLPMPFTPDISDAPVAAVHLVDNVWAFASYDAGGIASFCLGVCSDAPEVVLNPNYGLYQATLRIRPRLDVEIWRVRDFVTTNDHGASVFTQVPDRLVQFTATLHTRAFAECNRWETGIAALDAKFGIDEVTIQRDTGILEDLANFFLPGFSDQVNRVLRDQISNAIGVKKFANMPGNGTRCYTLGVRGGAADGGIVWNEERPPVNAQ
jgi:hypothetical protein